MRYVVSKIRLIKVVSVFDCVYVVIVMVVVSNGWSFLYFKISIELFNVVDFGCKMCKICYFSNIIW